VSDSAASIARSGTEHKESSDPWPPPADQSHEMPISNNSFWQQQYRAGYDQMARAVHQVMATDVRCRRAQRLKLAISPYWMTNKKEAPTGTLASSLGGLGALAATNIDIVAPQEGRGTGKVGCYWPHERDLNISDVDPNFGRYPNVEPNGTFGAQFWASTFELFNGGRAVVDRVNARRRNKLGCELTSGFLSCIVCFLHAHPQYISAIKYACTRVCAA
jgi:hypothetical protein